MSTTSIEQAVQAIRSIGALQNSINKQDETIADILARLDRIERQLQELTRPAEK